MLWSGAAEAFISFDFLLFFFLILILFLVKDEDCVPVVIHVQDWPTCPLVCIVVSHQMRKIIVIMVIRKALSQSSDYINHSAQSHTGCKLFPVGLVYYTPTETNFGPNITNCQRLLCCGPLVALSDIPKPLFEGIQFHDVWIWEIHGISRHNFATSMSELAEA